MFAWAAIVVLTASAPAEPPAIDDPSALREVARRAAAEERWCDAHHQFRKLFARTGELKHLYNAAELARAAGDHVGALAAYRDVRARDPAFTESARVDRAIQELERALANGDVGAQCPMPAPVCGNGAIEGVEACDDANANESDACTSTCALVAPTIPSAPTPAPETARVTAEPPERVASEGARVAESRGQSSVAVTGVVLAAAGGVAALGLGAWALALDSDLRARAPEVTSVQKDFALDVGWGVVLGAGAGAVVAGAGVALALTDEP